MKLVYVSLMGVLLGACSGYAPVRSSLTVGPNHSYIATAPGSGLPRRVEGPLLQACVNQASAQQKKELGSDFSYLRFDSDYLQVQKVGRYIGKQYIAARLDGQGGWWGTNDDGAGEYHEVTFSCLLNKRGAVHTVIEDQ